MLINQDFTQDRTKYIGGSDIGSILGLSKFRSPLEVWVEKTGKAIHHKDSLALRFGSFAEEFVASEYARATGFSLIHDRSIYLHPNHSFAAAHVDRLVVTEGKDTPPTRLLECKTANPFSRDEWGEPGTDQIPLGYLTQTAWYMSVTGIEHIDLAVLFGNSDFRIYTIKRDLELERLILDQAIHFWNEYVLKDIPPPTSSESDCQILFEKSNTNNSVEADAKVLAQITRFHALSNEIKKREEEIASIRQSIMNKMGLAETLESEGRLLATWRAPKISYRLDSKRLESEHPDLCQAYKTPIHNPRRLVIKD